MAEVDRNAPWHSRTAALGTCPRCSTHLVSGIFSATFGAFYTPVDEKNWHYMNVADLPPTFAGPTQPIYACPSCEMLLAGMATKTPPPMMAT